MVNIKINDVPISVEEGTTILEACREAKMIVPDSLLFKRYQRDRCLPCLRCRSKRYRTARHSPATDTVKDTNGDLHQLPKGT
ncbi:MAG: 2Fe-2S iron-sulfur cluster-binding protein [Anaerobutyricum soehngenii]